MPLTVGPGYLDELLRKRQAQEQARAQMVAASQMGINALGAFGEQQQQGARLRLDQDRAKRQDARADLANTREANNTRLRLEREARLDAAQQAAAARAEADIKLRLERESRLDAEAKLQAKKLQDEIERKAAADRFAEEKRGEDERRAALKARVTALGGNVDADAMESIVNEFGVSEDDVKVAAMEASAEMRTTGLKGRKTEAEIKKLERVPTGSADKAVRRMAEGADQLRKELNALPEVKVFNESNTSFSYMQQASSNDSPAGDVALIYAFMKTQDPTSTVRESEFSIAQHAGDFGDRVASYVGGVATGKRLTPDQRADLLKQAAAARDAHKAAADRRIAQYEQIARERDIPISQVSPPGGQPSGATRGRDMSADEFFGGP